MMKNDLNGSGAIAASLLQIRKNFEGRHELLEFFRISTLILGEIGTSNLLAAKAHIYIKSALANS